MADNTEIIGGVAVTVEADLSGLESGFASAVSTATQAGQDISSALTAASDTSSTDALSQSLLDVGTAAETAGSQMAAMANEPQTLAEYYDQLEAAAITASSSTEQLGSTVAEAASNFSEGASAADSLKQYVEDSGHAAEEAEGGFSKLTESLAAFAEALVITEGLKEFVSEALETFGAVERVSIALTALTGSAEIAEGMLARLKDLAITDALSFPQLISAAQRMTAFGIATDKIPALLDAAANAGVAGGRGFDAAANAILRMSAAGTVSGRMLVTLGLNTDTLGKSLGVASTEVSKAFKELDQSGRLDALSSALSKFGGLAQKEASALLGEWQNVKTQWEFVMEGIGEALAPAAEAIMSFVGGTIIPEIKEAVDVFNSLPGPVKEVTVVLAGIATVAVPVALSIKGIVSALEALSTIKAAVTAITATLTASTVAEAAAVTGDAAATAADTVAVEANTIAEVANTEATTARAVAAGVAAEASGAAAVASGAAATATVGATVATSAWAAATTLGATIATAASAAIGVLTLGVAAVKIADEQATGATVSWKDALLSFIGVESQAEVRTNALAASQNTLATDIKKATDALTAQGNKLREADTSYRQVASAANFAADALEAHRLKTEGLSQALAAAKIHLQQVSDDFHAGKASAEDLTKALDDVTAATNALKEPMSAAAKAAEEMAARMQNFRLRMAELPPIMATVSSATEVATAEAGAHSMAISLEVAQVLKLGTALVQAQTALANHRGSMEAVVQAENELAAAQAKLNKLVGETPDIGATFNPNPARELAAAIGAVSGQLPALQPFTQTLEQIDLEWANNSRHVNRLAKYDIPAAIQAYSDYIGKLQGVAAPIGQIYDAEEKLLQLEINAASQRGQDATSQIVQLTNLKEKTEALQFASQGLGDVYAGLVHSFDDAFVEMGKQLSDVAVGVESLGQAMHNFVQKIAGEVVNVLVRYAMGELKKAIVDVLGSLSSVGGGVGTLAGKLGGAIGKGASGATGAQMQAAVTQFHAAVTQFGASGTQLQAADTQFHAAVAQFQGSTVQLQSAVAQFQAGVTTYDTATTFFDETTALFDESTTLFDAATTFFDESTAFFDESAAFFDVSVVAFDTAVAAFSVAVATMAANQAGGILGGLLSIFAFKGGGEVGNVPILSYLHPKEMVLDADLTAGIKNIIASGSTNAGGLGNATININSGTLPNLSGFTEAVNSFTDAVASSARGDAQASPTSSAPSVSVSVAQAPSPRIAVPSIQAPEASAPKSPAPRTEPDPAISSVTASTFRASVGDFAEVAASLGKLPVAVTNFKSTTDSFVDGLSDLGSRMSKTGATSTAESGSSYSSPGLSGAVGLRLYAFEGGGDVPGNVLALLHAQEMVLPAPLAQGLRNLFAQGGLGGSMPNVNLSLPSVPSSAGSFALPSPGESSVSGSEGRAVFENCTFSGVTADMVSDIMNRVVQATRRAGTRW